MMVEPGFFRTDLLSTQSTTYARPSIDDYAERSKETVAAWSAMNASKAAIPAKLAAVLVELADHSNPPAGFTATAQTLSPSSLFCRRAFLRRRSSAETRRGPAISGPH
jgi:hypothetical protein